MSTDTNVIPRADLVMRAPCPECKGTAGQIREKSGQQCVYCVGCGRHCYNAPKADLGLAVRSLSSRPGIKPSVRFRVLSATAGHCLRCGRSAPESIINVDHLIPREAAYKAGFLDAFIDSEANLIPLCEECNLGKGKWFEECRDLIVRWGYIKLAIDREEGKTG